ncbi:MAG: PTS sugar transporter subunit IIA [Phycisphaerales bacterium]|nr:PTS sugar transporter subunit IIA [Phycisphaerales bacterium]
MLNLKELLSRDNILMNLETTTKEGIITEMIDRLVASGRITNRKAALKAIMEREKKMSTGMQNGIAIPHGKTNSVPDLVTALGIKPEGMDFESMDGLPSRIFIMTLSPVNRTGPHVQFLSEISRILENPDVRSRIIQAPDADSILALLGL